MRALNDDTIPNKIYIVVIWSSHTEPFLIFLAFFLLNSFCPYIWVLKLYLQSENYIFCQKGETQI